MEKATKKTQISWQLKKLIAKAVNGLYPDLGLKPEDVSLEHPSAEEHGDYSSNVALKIKGQISPASPGAGRVNTNTKDLQVSPKEIQVSPKEIAQKIVECLEQSRRRLDQVKKVEVGGTGFINFWLGEDYLVREIGEIRKKGEGYGGGGGYGGKKIMVEFAHPNTHKEMHIGHMRTLITGESLARIFEASGAEVFRANYQGDIGPHVAKAIWGTEKILQNEGSSWEEAEKLTLKQKAHLLGQGYIRGNKDYEDNKNEIDQLNKKLYLKDASVMAVYDRTKKWSLDYYEAFYDRFYTKFNRLFLESEVAEEGKKIVLENVPQVFEESDGAIIFNGEAFGLHKRVFVTSEGNPTYEAKEMALGPAEFKEFPFDNCVHVVASEQAGYFQVVFKALEQLNSKFAGREFHLSMGMVQLVGQKISSRTGVIITVDGLIDDVKELLRPKLHSDGFSGEEKEKVLETGTIGAVKYSVLKSGPLLNATFDLEKSVALDGDSGPYLQYTYARAHSVLRKSNLKSQISNLQITDQKLEPEELAILRYLYRFPEVVEQAAKTYSPNLVCSYLFELAKRFNGFYNNVPILGSQFTVHSSQSQKGSTLNREPDSTVNFRLALTEATSMVIKNGLNLLGIEALERM